MTELTAIAEVCMEAAVDAVPGGWELAVVGMGKLGGRELNYASDVDVLFLHREGGSGALHRAGRAAAAVIELLSAPGPEGIVLRVDPDLRPDAMRMLEPDAIVEGGPAAAPFLATVSYNEAARMLDGGEQVDALPLLPAIRMWMEPFVQEHYKPEPKRKVRRRDPLATDSAPGAIKSTAGRE